MIRLGKSAIILAVAAMGAPLLRPLAAQDGPPVAAQQLSPITGIAAQPEPTRGLLHVRGDADAVQLDARQAAAADVLAALAAKFRFSYRSATGLDTEVSGTYSGSLAHVLSRVLDGYDYVISHGISSFDVVVLAKRGEEPLAKRGDETVATVPESHPVSRHREQDRQHSSVN